MKEAFAFTFEGGVEYILDWVDRNNSISSLLFNLGPYGIKGNDKRVDVSGFVDILIGSGYAPYFLAKKLNSTEFNVIYLWSDDKGTSNARESARQIMQSKSLWFFNVIQSITPKYSIINSEGKKGYNIGSVKRVSEIENRMDWFINNKWDSSYHKPRRNSIFLRIKYNTSSMGLYEIFAENVSEIISNLDKFGIEYKKLDVSKLWN